MTIPSTITPAMARRIEIWPADRLVPGVEEWRDVVGFEDRYEVSSQGRIRRKSTGRILRPWIAGHGYYYVNLGRKTRTTIHAIVAIAFCGPKPSPLHEVAHWDGICTNNCAENLRWATHRENVEDQRRHGTLYLAAGPGFHGESHPRSKLSDRDVLDIRRLYHGRRGQLKELAAAYGVDPSTIRRAAIGAMWRHL